MAEQLNADQVALRALLREFEEGGGPQGPGSTLERHEMGDEIALCFTLRTGTILQLRDVERPANLQVKDSRSILKLILMFASIGRAAALELWMGDADRREGAALLIGAVSNYAKMLREMELRQAMHEEVGSDDDNDGNEAPIIETPEVGKGPRNPDGADGPR